MLKATLASLKRTSVPLAIILVDNSLDDAYFATLKHETQEHCVQAARNGGYGFGHNLAVTHLPQAPYHLVLNPDVLFQGDCLAAMISMMESQTDIGLLTPRILNADGSLQLVNKRDPSVLDLFLRRFVPKRFHHLPLLRNYMARYVMLDHGYETSYEVPFASGCCMLFRRSVWDKIDGFDERFFLYFEDADISRRARAVARVCYCPQAAIIHLWARTAHNSWQLTRVAIRAALTYFRIWGWRWV